MIYTSHLLLFTHIKWFTVILHIGYQIGTRITRIACKTSDFASTSGWSKYPLKTNGKSTFSLKNVPPTVPTHGPVRARAMRRRPLTYTSGTETRGSTCTHWNIMGNAIFRSYKLWLDFFVFSLGCRQPTSQWNAFLNSSFVNVSNSSPNIQHQRGSRFHWRHADKSLVKSVRIA